MKITKLELVNIRCFEHIAIPFSRISPSAVFIGKNGDGKSTILRSLAIGLCDQSSASALFRELHGKFIREDSVKPSKVVVDLAAGSYNYRTETTFRRVKGFETFDQAFFRWQGKSKPKKISHDEFPWERIVATGYGAGLRAQGTEGSVVSWALAKYLTKELMP